jgi:hypothetical protein
MDITLEQWDAAFNSQAKAFLVGVREAVVSIGSTPVASGIASAEARGSFGNVRPPGKPTC